MADAEFTFESKSWQRVMTKLRKKWDHILVGTSQVRKEFAGISSVIVFKDIIEHFENEQGPQGKWVKWSEAYAMHLNKIGRGGNKILQFSGRLRQSTQPQNWRSINEGVMFFNNAKTKDGFPYAQAHDQGGKEKGRPPKRSFMWLSSKAIDAIVRATEKWLAEDLRG